MHAAKIPNQLEILEIIEKVRQEYISRHNIPLISSELEHVIAFGCASYTSIPGGDTYEEKNKRLNYTDEEFKYCVRKYGLMKVLISKFKYNFRRNCFFMAWWICNKFGLNLYSKNEVMAAVYQGVNEVRSGLNPEEKLEEKIIQNLGRINKQIALEENIQVTTSKKNYYCDELKPRQIPIPAAKNEKNIKINRLSGY